MGAVRWWWTSRSPRLGQGPFLLPVAHVGEPAVVARVLAADGRMERLLETPGDGPHAAGADLAAVDLAQRYHLGGGAADEGLVGQVELVAAHRLRAHLVAEVAGQREDAVTRDA